MQIIYPSAKSFQNYTGKPELLNEYDINFSNAIPFLKKKVRLTLNLTETDFNKKNNFSSGIEEVYVSGFNKYHNSEKVEYCGNKYTYGRCVLSKNKKYNPIK